MRAFFRDWQASGLSQAGYCRKHGLSDKSFVYWKKRLVPARVAVSLVEVPRYQAAPVLSAMQAASSDAWESIWH